MGDLKTPFDKAVYPDTGDLSGAGVISRGTDPNVDTSGSSALQTSFDKPIHGNQDPAETANSVSGLPSQPNRFEPAGSPPEPPSLQDHQPGTIDKR